MRHLGLVLEVDGGGGDLEQLDPGLDGGGLRTVKAELKFIARSFPIVGLVCSNVVVWNSAADHLSVERGTKGFTLSTFSRKRTGGKGQQKIKFQC